MTEPSAPAAAPSRGQSLYWQLVINGTYRLAFTVTMCLVAATVAAYFVWDATRSTTVVDDRDDAAPATPQTSPYYEEIMARTDVAARARGYNATLGGLRDRGLIAPELADQARKDRKAYDPKHDAWSLTPAGGGSTSIFFNQGVTLK